MAKVGSFMDALKSKSERAVNAMANAVDKSEGSEVEFANTNLKTLDDYESYAKKHRTITNKILDAFQLITDQLGNLAELHRTRLQMVPQDQKEDQALSVNFLLFLQGNIQDVRNELCKGYANQMEYITGELSEVKGLFTKNMRKPVDTLETMVTMKYQLDRLLALRYKVLQRYQYSAFHILNENLTNFAMNNGQVYTSMKQLPDLEDDINNIHLRSVSYVGRNLGEILDDERRNHNEVPRVIEEIITQLETKYIDREGIFRTNASQKIVDELYQRLSVSDIPSYSCETLAAVLKKFVRQLPGMLFCNSLARDVMAIYKQSDDKAQRITNLASLFSTPKWITEEKKALFKAIIRLCNKISQRSEENLMDEKNLSVCWTPTMFSVDTNELPNYLEMVKFFITEYDSIFGNTLHFHQPLVIGQGGVRGRHPPVCARDAPTLQQEFQSSMIPRVPKEQPTVVSSAPMISLLDLTLEEPEDTTNDGTAACPILIQSQEQTQQPAFSPKEHQKDATRYPVLGQQRVNKMPPCVPPPPPPRRRAPKAPTTTLTNTQVAETPRDTNTVTNSLFLLDE